MSQVVEYCVHMKQFPSGQLFSERLKNGQLDLGTYSYLRFFNFNYFIGHMAALGRKVAQFHARCTTNEKVRKFVCFPRLF